MLFFWQQLQTQILTEADVKTQFEAMRHLLNKANTYIINFSLCSRPYGPHS